MADDFTLEVGVDTRDSLNEVRALSYAIEEAAAVLGKLQDRADATTRTMRELANENAKGFKRVQKQVKLGSLGTLEDESTLAGLQSYRRSQQARPENIQLALLKDADRFQKSMLSSGREALRTAERMGVVGEGLTRSQQLRAELEKETIRLGQLRNNSLDQQTDEIKKQLQLVSRLKTEERAAANFDSRVGTIERVTGDGGASLLKIQSRLLINYKLIEAAYSSFAFITRFTYELDKSLHQLQAVTASTDTAMAKLQERILDVSQDTKFTAVEIAEAATILGQAGFSGPQISAAISSISMLATAVGTDLGTAVKTATSVLNVFNLQAERMPDVASVITAAINRSKLSMEQLSLGLQYSSNIAAQSGVQFEELTATLGLLANAGIRSGSTLGTGTRQLLNTFNAPTQELIQTLRQYGLTVEDINVKNNGLIGVLKNLTEAGFTTADALRTMELRGANTFSALSRQLSVADDFYQSILLTNAAVEANAIQMGSLANTFDNFKSAVGALAYTGLEPFVAVLQKTLTLITDVAAVLRTEASPAVSIFTNALLGMVAVAAGAWAISLFKNMILLNAAMVKGGAAQLAFAKASGVATLALKALSIPMAGILGPLGLFIAAGYAISLLLDGLGITGNKAADELDQLGASFQEAGGKTDGLETSLEQVDEFMDKLIRRESRLKESNAELTSLLIEAEKAFNGLGAGIDHTSDSYESFVDKLTKLGPQIRGELLKALELEKAILENRITARSKQVTNFDSRRAVFDAVNELGGTYTTASGGTVDARGSLAPSILSQKFGFNDTVTGISTSLQGRGVDFARRASAFLTNPEARTDNREFVNLMREFAIARRQSEGGDPSVSRAVEILGKELQRLGALGAGDRDDRQKQVVIDQKLGSVNFQDNPEGVRAARALDDLKARVLRAEKLTAGPLKGDDPGFVPDPRFTPKEQATKAAKDIAKEVKTELEALQKEFGGNGAFSRSFGEKIVQIGSTATTVLTGISEEANKQELDRLKRLDKELTVEIQALQAELRTGSLNDQQSVADSLARAINKQTDTKIQLSEAEQIKEAKAFTASQLSELRGSDSFTTNQGLTAKSARLQAQQQLARIQDSITRAQTPRRVDTASRSTEALLLDQKRRRSELELEAELAQVQAEIAQEQLPSRTSNPDAFVSGYQKTLDSRKEFERSLELASKLLTIKTKETEELGIQREELRANLKLQQDAIEDLEKRRAYVPAAARKALDKELEDRRKAAADLEAAEQNMTVELEKQTFELEKQKQLYEAREKTVDPPAPTFGGAFRTSFEKFKEDLFSAKTVGEDLEQGFDNIFSSINSGFSQMITSVVSGTATMGDAFRSFAQSVIESMLEIAAQQAAAGILKLLIGTVSGAAGGSIGSSAAGGGTVIGNSMSGAGGQFGSALPWAGAATGGYIQGGTPGRDSVPLMTMPGEFVLQKSAVDALGVDTLHRLNAAGAGATKTLSSAMQGAQGQSKQSVTNVYVVQKDNLPPIGPNDVLAIVNDDIARGGQTKRLIKSVVA